MFTNSQKKKKSGEVLAFMEAYERQDLTFFFQFCDHLMAVNQFK